MDTTVIDGLIIGRVEPHIYAFSTQTIPDYLKVGDTYRPVDQRLNEWRKYFPNLEKIFSEIAKVDEDNYFRDFAIHYFLEQELHLKRLSPDTFKDLPYYSKEFFENATKDNIIEALADVKKAFFENSGKYRFYSFNDSPIPLTYTYKRNENYEPRPNQKDTIERFKNAVATGRTNLLMYAVMRFGKSFTSMCCALEMKADLVVIVSAKADVKQEWKRTVESHSKFDGYVFMDSDSLLADDNALSNIMATNKAVVFLTLQDLMGDVIKNKHKQIFNNQIDLLIIDETHYGVRAAEYGKVLNISIKQMTKDQLKNELFYADTSDNYENNETLKILNAKVRLHLSGTPYRILMGSEFTKDDIIAFYQFSDIVNDQEKWDDENLSKDEVKEWDNPYYGFPQMVRFAFNPNESAVRKIEEMRAAGISCAFSEFFRPKSISKDDSAEKNHQKFVHEDEILDLFEVIDGTKDDENILGFLDYDKIKNGNMCRHIVCVLPFRASCDALKCLLENNNNKFKNLNDYEIINIAGFDDERTYDDTLKVKEKIKDCEANNIKTITLTVNRMLTGSTVKEWDAMIYLKDTASPQEYDQAVFRLQNQYIRKYTDDNGDTIKYNMKPQTLLVDFNPNRMFRLQEQKSQIYNVNIDKQGNSKLEDRINKELHISPVIVLNKNKLQQVIPADILDAVREYSADKSVMDEATDIPTDLSLLSDEDIRSAIEALTPIDSSKGIELKSVEGDGDDLDIPDVNEKDGKKKDNDDRTNDMSTDSQPQADDNMDKKLATYYAQILFFAFLSDSEVKSVEEVIDSIESNDDNKRIARNIGLRKNILEIFQKKCNPFILSKLDYKIQNLNTLMRDTTLQADERVEVAMKKFGRLSSSEIVTPQPVAREMVDVLPAEEINSYTKILDIASKQGEFTRALYAKFGETIKDNIYAIPTSGITYEFTRKVYSLLNMPIKNVFSDFNTYDMIDDSKKDKIMNELKNINFDMIIGNPPYQKPTKDTSDKPIYYFYMDAAYDLAPKACLITPARFLFNAGKTPKQWNKKMLGNEHVNVVSYKPVSSDVFPDIDLKGGAAITYKNDKEIYGAIGIYTHYDELNSILKKVIESEDFNTITNIIYLQTKFKLDNLYKDYPNYMSLIGSNGREKRLTTNIFELLDVFTENRKSENQIEIIGLINNVRFNRYIEAKYIENNGNLNAFKVLLPKTNNTGQLGEELSSPMVIKSKVGYTQSFIGIGSFNAIIEAENALKYIKTKFARTMLGTLKVTQDNNKNTWQNVPLQDFTSNSDIDWTKTISEIDRQLYAKYGLTEEEIRFVEEMVKGME